MIPILTLDGTDVGLNSFYAYFETYADFMMYVDQPDFTWFRPTPVV
jgi:hypothetical protein